MDIISVHILYYDTISISFYEHVVYNVMTLKLLIPVVGFNLQLHSHKVKTL